MGEKFLRVLVVDDSEVIRQRLISLLDGIEGVEVVGEAGNARRGLELTQTLGPKLVLLDIRMPGGSGLGLLEEIKRIEPAPCVAIMTNYSYPQYRRRAFELGANFFLDKSMGLEGLEEFVESLLTGQIESDSIPLMATDTRRVLILDDEPQVLDLLTAQLRSPWLDLFACREIEAAECLLRHYSFDVLVTDLQVSDLGGLEGMRLIRFVATNFPETTVLVFSGLVDENVRRMAKALGVSEVLEKPAGLDRLRTILRSHSGDGHAAPGNGNVHLVEPLSEVLRNRGISSVLQPIVELNQGDSSKAVYGVECLARGPQGSVLENPEILFGYAAQKEMLFETDLHCLEAAFLESSRLPAGGKVFVNVHPHSMSRPDLTERLLDLMRAQGVDEGQVVVELTEQGSILNLSAVSSSFDSLRRNGVQLALDDFGEGHSNASLVEALQPDFLKISGIFSKAIHEEVRKQAIIASTVEMAGRLGIRTIAEKVETAAELATLRGLGVQYGQGHFIAAPAPADELPQALRFWM